MSARDAYRRKLAQRDRGELKSFGTKRLPSCWVNCSVGPIRNVVPNNTLGTGIESQIGTFHAFARFNPHPTGIAFCSRTASSHCVGTDQMEKSAVLILERESLIRLNIVLVAEEAGYEVLEAENAEEAIGVLESSTDVVAVFTTVRLPGSMDGLALASSIRSRWPLIRVIVTSGRDVESDPKFPANCRFIQKPYEDEQITAALRAVRSHH